MRSLHSFNKLQSLLVSANNRSTARWAHRSDLILIIMYLLRPSHRLRLLSYVSYFLPLISSRGTAMKTPTVATGHHHTISYFPWVCLRLLAGVILNLESRILYYLHCALCVVVALWYNECLYTWEIFILFVNTLKQHTVFLWRSNLIDGNGIKKYFETLKSEIRIVSVLPGIGDSCKCERVDSII